LKLVEGNRGKRALNQQEPDPDYLQDLTPPAWLPDGAKVVWDQLAPQLTRSKLLTVVDVHALEMGCVAIANYRMATEQAGARLVINVAKDGGEIAQDDDEPGATAARGGALNPWLIIQSMAYKQAMAVLREFGATPAARSRVAINPQGQLFSDPAANYFG
jgi:P27 family predicted phage terminase small subunit